MTELQKVFESFRSVLDRLAAPADAQIEYLVELGVADSVDELALEFDDLFRPLEPALSSLPNGAEISAACHAIDAAIMEESLGWTFDDLSTPRWSSLRRLAAQARGILDVALGRCAP